MFSTFPFLVLHIFLLFLSVSTCVAPAPPHPRFSNPYIDEPFFDPYAVLRWTLADSPKIADWEVLPLTKSETPVQLAVLAEESGSTTPNTLLLALGGKSLWLGERMSQSTFSWIRIDVELGLSVDLGCRVRPLVEESNQKTKNDGENSFVLVCPESVSYVRCGGLEMCSVVGKLSDVTLGNVRAVTPYCEKGGDGVGTTRTVFVGAESGLFELRIDLTSAAAAAALSLSIHRLDSAGVSSIDVFPAESGTWCGVAFGMPDLHRLFFVDSPEIHDRNQWRFFWIHNLVDDNVTSVVFDVSDGSLYVGSKSALNVLDAEHELIDRIGGLEGLPFGNVTCSLSTKQRLFFGSKMGISMLDKSEMAWHYMNGDRYVHGSEILSLASMTDGELIVLTESGGSIIGFKEWTLEDKAAFYESMVEPRHDRYGLVSDVGLRKYGDLSTYYKRASDNDGSWTGMYLQGEIFQYAVTRSADSKKRVWKAFDAMEFLVHARSILPRNSPIPGGEWFNSTLFPEFQFKANTSSDEVANHILAYILMYDHVVENQSERDRVVNLVDSIVTNIITHDFYLLDYNSTKPTTWGKWNPKWVNDGGNNYNVWANNRGLNSIEILAMCLTGYYMTGAEKYLTAYRKLVSYGYVTNVLNTKIMAPMNINHSDDELESIATLALHIALSHLVDSEFDLLRANLKKCSARSHKYIDKERSAMFDPVYQVITDDESYDASKIAWTLQTWPQELIDWPVRNSQRIDVRLNPDPLIRSMLSPNERMRLLPYNERGNYRWNGDCHSLNGGSGFKEYDPGAWVFGYWISRYYGLIQTKEAQEKAVGLKKSIPTLS